MPIWNVSREWEGQSAYLIGGGSSLLGWDFTRLKGLNTIGCNDAFRLGPDICKICIFGDYSFWNKNKEELAKFNGRVVCCAPRITGEAEEPWLLKINRKNHGLGLEGEGKLAWNYSTGSLAINLAILLGAVKIYLLGYDLGRVRGTHWHNHRNRATNQSSYNRFTRGFEILAGGLEAAYPHVKIVNVTVENSSKLTLFPRVDISQVFPPLFYKQECRAA